MKITSQNYYNTYHQLNTHSFSGKTKNLERVLDSVINKETITEVERSAIIDKIKLSLSEIIKPKNFIGKGTHNSIYQITPKYVARFPNNAEITPESIGEQLKWGKNVFKTLANYFGEPILQLGKLQILKNAANQMPAGIPEHLTDFLSRNKLNKYYTRHYLPKYSRVSQKEYNKLGLTLMALNMMSFGPRMYGLFDSHNPNNTVLSKGRLILVDEIYTLCNYSHSNTIAKLMNVFILKATRNLESPDPTTPRELKQFRKIFKKVLLAGTKGDLIPIDSKDDIELFDKALKKCKIDDRWQDIVATLDRIVRNEKDIDERVKLTEKYIDTIFAKNPINKRCQK